MVHGSWVMAQGAPGPRRGGGGEGGRGVVMRFEVSGGFQVGSQNIYKISVLDFLSFSWYFFAFLGISWLIICLNWLTRLILLSVNNITFGQLLALSIN